MEEEGREFGKMGGALENEERNKKITATVVQSTHIVCTDTQPKHHTLSQLTYDRSDHPRPIYEPTPRIHAVHRDSIA